MIWWRLSLEYLSKESVMMKYFQCSIIWISYLSLVQWSLSEQLCQYPNLKSQAYMLDYLFNQFLKNFNVKIVEYLLPISKLNKPIYNYCLLDVTQASFVGAYQLFVWLLRHGSVFKTLYTTHNLWRLGSKMQASRIVEHIMVTYILLVYNCFYELGYWLTRHGQPVCKAINTRKHILKCRE